MIFIFFLSSWSAFATLQSPKGLDKIFHAIMWFVLCFLTRRAFFFQERFGWLRRHDIWAALMATTLYGGLDEYYQSFVPARTSDIADVVADFTGALLFVLLFLSGGRLRRRRENVEEV
ncbi:MAG: hypothetical protein A2059_01150 [Ignavibacteria bacterium GWA2_55_25]|nr:MAG: hypothetical protein A2059_01150 [Ignavibacteria bacterium GWA2_55_25]